MSYPRLSDLDQAVRKYVALQHGWKLDLRCTCTTPQPGFMLLDGYYYRVCFNCGKGLPRVVQPQ